MLLFPTVKRLKVCSENFVESSKDEDSVHWQSSVKLECKQVLDSGTGLPYLLCSIGSK